MKQYGSDEMTGLYFLYGGLFIVMVGGLKLVDIICFLYAWFYGTHDIYFFEYVQICKAIYSTAFSVRC